MTTINGTCKWFNIQKGFGIIDIDGEEVFVHYSELADGDEFLKEHDKVSVDKIEIVSKKGKEKSTAFGVCRLNRKGEIRKRHTLKETGKRDKGKRRRPKNTVSFNPTSSADMRIQFHHCQGENHFQPKVSSKDVVVVNNLFEDGSESWYDKLVQEVLGSDVWKSWHGGSHDIADDKLKWKDHSPTFLAIVEKIAAYFQMDINATRLNYYKDASSWKPYHHDAAAIKKDKKEGSKKKKKERKRTKKNIKKKK